MRPRKLKGPTRVAYQLIDRESATGKPMYQMLRRLVDAHHEDLHDARIALAWCTSWRPDVDGRCVLGKCRRASELDRELAQFDFVILLRRTFWIDERVSELQRHALLDHELHHAAVKVNDRTGEPEYNERGRKIFRTRKHDLEEFTAIVERYGTWTRDVELFYAALRRGDAAGFTPCDECKDSPGYVISDSLLPTVQRCACWLAWRDRQKDHDEEPASRTAASVGA